MPWMGGGGKLASLDPGLRTTISVDFLVFSMRLLSADQLSIAWSSRWMVCDCEAGTIRVTIVGIFEKFVPQTDCFEVGSVNNI